MHHNEQVSILMLTRNATWYVIKSLKSLRKTKNVDYEIIVVDNDSNLLLKILLTLFLRMGWITTLCMLNYNSYFAAGNNIASRLASLKSDYFLLLNSDVEIHSPEWLNVLLDVHSKGITTFGVVEGNPITRVDGYCLLINSDLYRTYKLDETYPWWWAVTKLQAQILTNAYHVQGFRDHEEYLHHFGGKSGKGYQMAKNLDINHDEVKAWFQEKTITLLD